MAINIEWQVKPPSKNDDKPQMFPRITDSEIVNEQQLAELIASHCTLSRGNAKAALGDLAEVMADLLREGKTINIPMLGSFRLSIGTDSEIGWDISGQVVPEITTGRVSIWNSVSETASSMRESRTASPLTSENWHSTSTHRLQQSVSQRPHAKAGEYLIPSPHASP